MKPLRKLIVGLSSTVFAIAQSSCNNTGITDSQPSSSLQKASADERADKLVKQLTLDEKIQLVHGGAPLDWGNHLLPRGGNGWIPGIPRLGIPDLYLADGSVGVGNNVGPATALPSSIASAASWDLNEAYKYGQVIGRELRAYGINVNLGGNVNLAGREPRDGRTFETKGEDPLLAGKITAQHLKAIQDQHVIAVIKHFAINDQETGRSTANALIDERSARESDLLAFEIGIKESKAQSAMCSYSLVNDVHACENSYLLNEVLKRDWEFPGFIMSDWDATHSTVGAALNGLDQEQPEDIYFGSNLKEAVLSGEVSQNRLDDMVRRILRAMFAVGLFDHTTTIHPIDEVEDATVAQEVEEQGAVLLKNASMLPLDSQKLASVAVIGSHADIAVLSGGGSAQVTPVGGFALTEGKPCPPCWAPVVWDPSSLLDAIRTKVPGARVQYNDGIDVTSAAILAAASNVAIVLVSQWESEGMDVPSLNFTDVIHSPPIDQDALVQAVAAANRNTIVVLENGGPKVMPWINIVNAVLEAWYPGQRGGEAIANLLFGEVNPSGKLPLTFPASIDELARPTIATPLDPVTPFPVDYTIDGYNVGYKWYEKKGFTPLFPFGFGLSYTTFSITNPRAVWEPSETGPAVRVSFDLQNTGTCAGAEVAQLYLELPPEAGEPKRLIGWQKVFLTPNESKNVQISVRAVDSSHPFSYWDVGGHAWIAPRGIYTVLLGNSSRDLITVGSFQLGDIESNQTSVELLNRQPRRNSISNRLTPHK